MIYKLFSCSPNISRGYHAGKPIESVVYYLMEHNIQFPIPETIREMGTSFWFNHFWDPLGGQAIVLIGWWYSRQPLTNHKLLRRELIPISLVVSRVGNSSPFILVLLTNKDIALIYSVTICEHKIEDCTHQGASNINCSIVVFKFDVCHLSYQVPFTNHGERNCKS